MLIFRAWATCVCTDPEKVVVLVFAIGSCIYQFFVIVRRHLVRILSTFQLRARLQNSRGFFLKMV